MFFLRTVLSVLVCSVSILGCATYKAPLKKDVVTERTYTKSFDRVWDSIIEWFAKNNTPIKNLDKSSGFISTEYSLGNNISQSCDCGTPGFGQSLAGYIGNYNVIVRKVDDSTVRVNVSVFFKATLSSPNYPATAPPILTLVDCVSTGYLEKAILNAAEQL